MSRSKSGQRQVSRRGVLQGAAALGLAGGSVFPSARVLAAAPPATAITPELVAAAEKEGKVVYYTSVEIKLAETVAKAFETRYPKIKVRVERSGAERIFQRIGQERASNINACDTVNSSDAAHLIVWKREGLLEPFVPRTSPSTMGPPTRTRTAPMRRGASTRAPSPTTPSW